MIIIDLPDAYRDTPYIRGYDISKWNFLSQGDFEISVSQGMEFVYQRMTYGTTPDPSAPQHCDDARRAGLSVGGYHFYRHDQWVMAQVDAFKAALQASGCDQPGSLMPVIDVENDGGQTVTDEWGNGLSLLAGEVKRLYGGVILYLSDSVASIFAGEAWFDPKPLWIARYPAYGKEIYPPPRCNHEWRILQYGVTQGFQPGGIQSAGSGAIDHNVAKAPLLRISR